jgi:hypothetical protein
MNNSVQHEVYGNTYLFGKLNAFQQFHVMRRLASVSSGLGEGISRLQAGGGAAKMQETGAILSVIQPLISAIGNMSNEDSEYVLQTCLGVVQRRVGTSFSPIQSAPGDLMFPDIEMLTMVMLVWRTLEFNLGSFFDVLRSVLPKADSEDSTLNSLNSQTA